MEVNPLSIASIIFIPIGITIHVAQKITHEKTQKSLNELEHLKVEVI